MKDLYLYHATDKANLESILRNGLLINSEVETNKEDL